MPQDPASSAADRRTRPKRRARGKRRHTVLRAVVATAAVLALVTTLTAAFAYRQLGANIDTFADSEQRMGERPDKGAADTPQEPLNILLVGSDLNNPEEGARSDTAIVMHVSGDRDFAYGISLPRDALVDRPDCELEDGEVVPGEEMVMFNTAYDEADAICTARTVESLTGIYVDATVEMDFGGFEDMVDAIDGVDICLPEPIEESRFNDALPREGTFTATGAEALIYVRERHQLSINGDVGRMKRQQAFLASMANKVVSAETLTNPSRITGFLEAVTGSMTITEEYRDLAKLGQLGLQLNGIGLDNITFLTVPSEEWVEDPNRLVWTDEADDLWTLVRTDQPLTPQFLEGSIGAEESGGSVNTGGPAPAPTGSATDAPTTGTSDDPSDDSADDPTTTAPEGIDAEEFADQNGLC